MTRAFPAIGALTLATLLGGCASTPGAIPQPFPRYGAARPEALPDPGAEGDRTPDISRAPLNGDRPLSPWPASLSVDTYALVGTALEFRGVPYRTGGTSPEGFDCSGFTQFVFAQYHVALPREVRDQFRTGQTVSLDNLAPGDLLFFSTTEPGASHVGIAVGFDEFVHAPNSTGVVRVERLSSSYWSQRFLGARRVTPP